MYQELVVDLGGKSMSESLGDFHFINFVLYISIPDANYVIKKKNNKNHQK